MRADSWRCRGSHTSPPRGDSEAYDTRLSLSKTVRGVIPKRLTAPTKSRIVGDREEGGSSLSLLLIPTIVLLIIATTLAIRHGFPMASFKNNHSRTPQQVTVPAIKLAGEQDGPPERDLKARLIKLFRDEPMVERAYLARTDYGAAMGLQVTLCVVSSNVEGKLVSQVSEIFADMFGSHEHLDILFIREEQERQLRTVCPPFYNRNS